MNTIQIKTWNARKVIFEYEAENATMKDAVEEAIRQETCLAFADLRGADLKGANLAFAELNYADLSGANLRGAYLCNAFLYNVGLKGADLSKANLRNAELRCANLSEANFKYAYLNGTNLKCADLKGATLRGANLKCAYLKLAKNIPDDIMPLACPAEGSFIAWKKVGDKLVKLEIPSDAKRSSATTNKCRCSKAKVLAITNLGETKTYDAVFNGKYAPLAYKVGEMVYPDSFDEDRWNECSHGIHFFMDKKEAINW